MLTLGGCVGFFDFCVFLPLFCIEIIHKINSQSAKQIHIQIIYHSQILYMYFKKLFCEHRDTIKDTKQLATPFLWPKNVTYNRYRLFQESSGHSNPMGPSYDLSVKHKVNQCLTRLYFKARTSLTL